MRGSSKATNHALNPRICLLTAAFLILWSAVCGFSTFAISPKNAIAQYVHDSWTHQSGLPGEAVYQIIQTDDGYLWLRTSSGLVRFDGVRFVRVDPIVDGQPVREQVNAICKGAAGDLLVRTASRTLIYRSGVFSDYRAPAPLPDGAVTKLFETREHQVFVGADNFIYLINNRGVKLLRENTGPVLSFIEDQEGILWIGSIRALYTYRDGKLSVYREEPENMDVNVLAEDNGHNLWLGDRIGLYRMRPDKPILERFAPDQIQSDVRAILQDLRGNLWVGTGGSGVFRFADGRWSSYKAVDGLSDNDVLSLYEDREGSIWVGTADGLNRFRDAKLTTFTVADGLPSNDGNLIVEAEDGSVYAYCGASGLARIKNGVVSQVANQGPLAHIYAGSMFVSRDGSLWIGTEKGLARFKNGAFTYYRGPGPLSGYISAINEDDESLIFSSYPVVYRLKDGKAIPLTIGGRETPFSRPADGNYTFYIYRDKSGTMWFGAVGGLFKFSKGESPENAKLPQINFPVTSIYDDGKGYLWLGGRTPGMTRLRIQDGRVTRYTGQQGLFDEYPTRILSDRRDNLWISTPKGIYSIGRKDLDDVAEGRIPKVSATIYDMSDGMKTTEAANPSAQPGGWRTRDGKLWFSMRKGLVVIDPDHIPHNNQVPPVRMEEIVVDQKTLLPSKNITLKPGTNNLEFHYTALSFLVPLRVRFKYKLEGYDRDWVEAGPRRVAYYTKLPPGQYRFRVIASNDEGVWNTEGATLGFYLKPFFYQTKWFLGLCSFGVLLSGTGLYLLRVRRLRVREKHLEVLVNQRTTEIKKEVEERKCAEEALSRARDELEDRVRQRTAELAAANKALETDILERRRVEEQLRQSQKMEALGQLAGGVAHDFNNLLEVIIGYSELIRDTIESGSAQRPHIQQVQNAAERAAGLTRQLLAFSRKQMLQPAELDLNVIVAEVEKLLRRVIGERIELVTKLIPGLGCVRADRGQIEQVILNLCLNARDAMPKGGRLIIETANMELDGAYTYKHPEATPGSFVMLAVSDTGIGMDAATRERIFEPFFTTKERGKGTGLGLATVYGIVKQSGGHIWVYSEPGRGATFKVFLPLVTPAHAPLEKTLVTSESSRGTETVLVVEDEEGVRKLVCESLSARGYQMLSAENAERAMALSQENQRTIHLLVTDMVMPGKGGQDLARELLSLRPDLKILFLSGYTDTQFSGLANEMAFLQKPFTLQALAGKVRELLNTLPYQP